MAYRAPIWHSGESIQKQFHYLFSFSAFNVNHFELDVRELSIPTFKLLNNFFVF